MANETTEKVGAIRPTLFIGLGGTGKEVLLRLRRKFYERFGEPRLPCTAFLWLDTDTRDVMAQGERIDEIYQAVRFKEEERLALLEGRVSGLSDVFQNKSQWQHVHEWLYEEVERYGQEISDGAGGVRAVGRLTFYHSYPDVRQRIEELLGSRGLNSQEVIDRTYEVFKKLRLPEGEFVTPPNPQVFLIFSVAGGTGCGTFLDTAFLLRDIGVERIFSIVFLPSVYYTTPRGELAMRSYGNAYAALKELEFYTLRQERHGRSRDGGTETADGISVNFDVEWRSGEYKSVKGPPFTVAYCVGMMNEGGIGLQTRQELFSMVGETLFLDFMPGQFSTAKRSHYANVAQYLSSPEARNISVQGQGITLSQAFARRYASFGMSKIEVPVDSVKGACAAQLVYDIASYWNHEGDDPDIRRNVANDMARQEIDADGIAKRYSDAWNWKGTIRNQIATLFRGVQVTNTQELRDLEEKLATFERSALRGEGQDQALWGEVVSALRASTPRVVEDAKTALLDWIRDSLENPARRLTSMFKDGGYLHILETEMLGYHTPKEQDYIPEFVKLKEEAERDAESYKKEKDKHLQDLRTALESNLALAFLRRRETTIAVLLTRLQDAEEQYALAQADAYLYEEARKAAQVLHGYLAEWRSELKGFANFLPGIIADFEKKKKSFLNFSEGVLFVRHFNEVEDFKNFYRLDGKPIDAQTAQREFLDWLAREKRDIFPVNFSPPAKLLHVVGAVAARKGDGELRTGLQDFCEWRFREDFNASPREVEVLGHPYMVNRWDESIEKLVRCALPMTQREKVLAGSPVATQSLIYIQMAKDPKRDGVYRRFYEDVCNRLVAGGYNRDHINPCLDDRRSSEVSLYIASYAFPLPALPVVKKECHQAYYDFYRAQVAGQVGEQRNHISLHLSKRWEGKFGDLKIYDDKEAREIKGALETLLFGSILRILELRQKEGVSEFGYRKWVPPSPQREPLGNHREAVEALKGDPRFREELLRVIGEREEGLSTEQLQDYYWLLAHLSRSGDYPSGMPEKVLLDTKLGVIHDQWFPRRGIIPESVQEWDGLSAGEVLAEGEEEKKVAAAAREKLGDRVLWVGSFPVLKELAPWVRGKKN